MKLTKTPGRENKMKLTKTKLKQIIREELLKEFKDPEGEHWYDYQIEKLDNAIETLREVEYDAFVQEPLKHNKQTVKQISQLVKKLDKLVGKLNKK